MNALTMNEPAEVFPPGEFLKDELEARNWSQTEFAEIIGRPVRLINEIIGGKKSITPETAVQLGASLGTSAELWMNLESQFQLSKVRKDNDAIQRKAKLYERFPVREMTRRGWVEKTEDIGVLEYQFTKFFDIKSVEEPIQLPHAAKKGCYDGVSVLQWAWLHRVKQIAQTFVLKKYTKDALVDALPKLHALMSAPEEIRKVTQILNEAGVRFVVVEALPGTKIDGACLWLSDTQPVIAVSVRLDRIDNFWFVLRHEIEHLLQEHGKSNRLMFDEDISEDAEDGLIFEERVANDAAAEFCVSDKDLQNYMLRVNPFYFAEDRILGFSGRLGVHPGIVVGRLQKKLDKAGYPNPYKYLRSYLVKVREIIKQSSPSDGWGEIHPLA